MTAFLADYGLFLAKTVTLIAALAGFVALVAALARGARSGGSADRLEVKNLNDRYEQMADALNAELLDDAGWKKLLKQRKSEDKAREKGSDAEKPRLFVLDFDGDVEASQVAALREEISALLQVAREGDSVLLRLDSGGGVVHGYGLAASQLQRLKARGLKLTVAVDKVAASGGYLMACVADEIVAAPFAVLGSIGVVAQLPNFHRLLDKNSIDIELHTAGEYKRTLTMLGENTDAARAKFRQELEEIHDLFKRYVAEHRAKLDIARVATGEHWYGTQALELGLVDRLATSDDLLLERVATHAVHELHFRARRSLREHLLGTLGRIRGSMQSLPVAAASAAIEPWKAVR